MEVQSGGISAAVRSTEEEVREVKAQLRANFFEEKRLLADLRRWAALNPDAEQGRLEALRLYGPRVEELLARRKKLIERLLATEKPRLQEAYERLRAGAEGQEEGTRPGTPMKETPAVSR